VLLFQLLHRVPADASLGGSALIRSRLGWHANALRKAWVSIEVEVASSLNGEVVGGSWHVEARVWHAHREVHTAKVLRHSSHVLAVHHLLLEHLLLKHVLLNSSLAGDVLLLLVLDLVLDFCVAHRLLARGRAEVAEILRLLKLTEGPLIEGRGEHLRIGIIGVNISLHTLHRGGGAHVERSVVLPVASHEIFIIDGAFFHRRGELTTDLLVQSSVALVLPNVGVSLHVARIFHIEQLVEVGAAAHELRRVAVVLTAALDLVLNETIGLNNKVLDLLNALLRHVCYHDLEGSCGEIEEEVDENRGQLAPLAEDPPLNFQDVLAEHVVEVKLTLQLRHGNPDTDCKLESWHGG